MNGYAGSLKMGTAKKLGLLHGSYGALQLSSTYSDLFETHPRIQSPLLSRCGSNDVATSCYLFFHCTTLDVPFRNISRTCCFEHRIPRRRFPKKDAGWSVFMYAPTVSRARGNLSSTYHLHADVMVEEGEELPEAQAGASGESKYSQIFKCKAVHYMALFSIIYIGVEVTMGGELHFWLALK